MKSVIKFFFLILLMFCILDVFSQTTQTYSCKYYSFSYPQGWSVNVPKNPGLLVTDASEMVIVKQGTSGATIMAQMEYNPELDYSEITQSDLNNLKLSFLSEDANMVFIQSPTKTTYKGYPCIKMSYTTYLNGIKFKFIQYAFKYSSYVYRITGMARINNTSEYQQVLNSLNSFSIKSNNSNTQNSTVHKTYGTDNTNYNFVDLGLSVKWATCNVGAKNSGDYGKYLTDRDALNLQKTSYRLPTREECWELLQECRWEWKGNGYKVIGKNGNSIFLPVAGYQEDYNYRWVGSEGYFWSSSDAGDYAGMNFLAFDKNRKYISCGLNGDKLSVRFVKK